MKAMTGRAIRSHLAELGLPPDVALATDVDIGDSDVVGSRRVLYRMAGGAVSALMRNVGKACLRHPYLCEAHGGHLPTRLLGEALHYVASRAHLALAEQLVERAP